MRTPAEMPVRKAVAVSLVTGILTGISATPAMAAPEPRREQWVFNRWSLKQDVWPLSTGKGVTVAVVDLGVQASLPELRGVVLPGKSFAPGGAGGKDGRVDEDLYAGGRGTEAAALIAAQGGGSGMAGVAPDVRILPVAGTGTDGRLAQGIRYAADRGAKVINMSFGSREGACPAEIQQAVGHAISRDAVLVAAAGSKAPPGYPASCAGVLAVGAVDGDKKLWPRSQQADYVMAVAPGVLIGTVGSDGKFGAGRSGTSLSAALTSGAVALLRAKFPEQSGRQVVQRILATASDIGPPGWDRSSGFGVIVPRLALGNAVPGNAANPVYERFDRWKASAPPGSPANQGPGRPVADKKKPDDSLLPIVLGAGVGVVLLVGLALLLVQIRRRPS